MTQARRLLARPWFRITLVGLTLALLVTLYRFDQDWKLRNQPPGEVPVVTVEGAPVEIGPISQWAVGEGTALAVRKRHLVFEVSGRVEVLARRQDGSPLREGDAVRGPSLGESRGQLLAELDRRVHQEGVNAASAQVEDAARNAEASAAGVQAAEAELKFANDQFTRITKLRDSGAVPEAAYRESTRRLQVATEQHREAKARSLAATAQVAQAEANLAVRRTTLERTSLHAPFDATIGRINIKPGDLISPEQVATESASSRLNTAPITLVDLSELEIALNLPVYYASDVDVGDRVVIVPSGLEESLASDPTEEGDFPVGSVYSVSPALDPVGRTVRVLVRLVQERPVGSAAGAGWTVLDGMFVTCWIESGTRDNARIIPLRALLFDDDQPYVYVAEDGVARRRGVELGFSDDRQVEILEGLNTAEWIVLGGKALLTDGSKIRLLPLRDDRGAGGDA